MKRGRKYTFNLKDVTSTMPLYLLSQAVPINNSSVTTFGAAGIQYQDVVRTVYIPEDQHYQSIMTWDVSPTDNSLVYQSSLTGHYVSGRIH